MQVRNSIHYPLSTATFRDSTCCVIKPHAVMAGQYGDIIADIMEAGYKVTGLQTFHLDYGNAEEFYEIYRGKRRVGQKKDKIKHDTPNAV